MWISARLIRNFLRDDKRKELIGVKGGAFRVSDENVDLFLELGRQREEKTVVDLEVDLHADWLGEGVDNLQLHYQLNVDFVLLEVVWQSKRIIRRRSILHHSIVPFPLGPICEEIGVTDLQLEVLFVLHLQRDLSQVDVQNHLA